MADAAAAASPPAPSTPQVTPQDPLPRRLLAYTNERFPLVPMGIFSLVTVVCASAAAALALGRAPVRLDLVVLATAAVHLLTLLLLRVLDEFKDHEKDLKAYPERCLSRGVVTLPLLRRVGWTVGLLCVGLAALPGLVPWSAYLVVLGFGLLMAKEFFVGAWLEKDVFVYAALHQPINPLITLWLFVAFAARGATDLAGVPAIPPAFWWFVAAQFALGFGFEVARKVWTPAEERPDVVQSYSAHAVGPRGAASIALGLLLGGLGCTVAFAVQTGLPLWVHVPLGLCTLLVLTSVGRFAAAPFPGASKKLQGAIGLGSLILHVGLIAACLAKAGVELRALPGGTQ
jgi:hypothetical protein